MSGTPAAPHQPRSAGHLLRSSAVVAAGTGLSRLTGFGRVAVMAYALGTTALAEAYNLANNTPNLLYDLVLGGILSATLVPVVVERMSRDDRDGINAVATVITVVLLATTVIGMIAAPAIIWLFNLSAPAGQYSEQAKVAVPLLVLFVPQILFYGLTSLGTALLNAKRSFAVPAFAPVLNNVIVICLFLALPRLAGGDSPTFDQVRDDTGLLLLLGLGTTAGIVAMTAVLWPAIRRADIHLRWNFDIRHPAVREIGRLSGWTFGYVVTNLVSYMVIQTFANGVDGVTIYGYAWLFFQLPYGLWTVSVMTSYTPELSALHSSGNSAGLRTRFESGLRLILVFVLPATVGMALLADPIVSVVLEHGEFSGAAADTTGDTLVAFAVGLPAFSLFLFAMRGFYAQRDTRTPFFINLSESILAVALAALLVDRFEVVGLGAAGSIAYSVFAIAAVFVLWRRIGPFLDRNSFIAIAKLVGASAFMGLIVWATMHILGAGSLVTVIVATTVGLVSYLLALTALRSTETTALIGRFRSRSRR